MTVTYASPSSLPDTSGSGRAKRDVGRAMMFGAKGKCPSCGTGRLYGCCLIATAEDMLQRLDS